MKNILLKIRECGEFIEFQTIDKAHGASQRFLASKRGLSKLWDGELFLETDLHNVMKASEYNGCTHIKFWWVREKWNREIEGYMQTFMVANTDICAAFDNPEPVKLLVDNEYKPCKICITDAAQAEIGQLSHDKQRALRKFMRDAFRWKDSEVTIYRDGNRDFFFREEGGICGGIIWSEYSHTYSMHT